MPAEEIHVLLYDTLYNVSHGWITKNKITCMNHTPFQKKQVREATSLNSFRGFNANGPTLFPTCAPCFLAAYLTSELQTQPHYYYVSTEMA